jgi:alkanesulfonate monooxygenase SsuD/methylene tetrahydromethanopterin reductase-like flavin-dependent oxidoreductase (luciferase family)
MLPAFEDPPTGDKHGWPEVRQIATLAEQIGFDTLWVPDELIWRLKSWPGPRGFWECVAMTGAVAASTQRIQVGTWVMSTLYRNPALVAKIAETLDEIAGGRFVLGLGSGHGGKQIAEFGYPTTRSAASPRRSRSSSRSCAGARPSSTARTTRRPGPRSGLGARTRARSRS